MPESFMLCLLGLFAMCFVANGSLWMPVPVASTVIWLGGQYHRPEQLVAIALVATTANVLGWLSMVYGLHAWPTLQNRLAGLRQKSQQLAQQQAFQQASLGMIAQWLKPLVSYPKRLLFCINLIPFIGFDPLRFWALFQPTLPDWRWAFVLMLARILRYSLLLFMGYALKDYQQAFWLLIIGLVFVPAFLPSVLPTILKVLRPAKSTSDPDGLADDPA